MCVSKKFDTLLENASIFSRSCSPLHAALGQRATQDHTGGLRSVFSDAHVPEKTDFDLFSRPRAEKLCRGLFMVQDDVFFLHEYEVIDSLSFSAKIPCRFRQGI